MSALRWLALLLLIVGCASQKTVGSSASPGASQSSADGGAAVERIILPSRRGPPGGLQSQFVGGGPCSTDADCAVSSATGECGPCGGCSAAMTKAEADRRERVICPPWDGPPTPCGPCPTGPDRAVCIDNQCIGLSDPPPSSYGENCVRDADCLLAAFEGCCRCPQHWQAVRRSWLEEAERFCAAQACGLEPSACGKPPPAPSVAKCRQGRCDAEGGSPLILR